MVISLPQVGAPQRPDPVRALLAPSTWLAAAHLLLDVAFGSAYAFVLLTGLLVSAVLMPFACWASPCGSSPSG
jgi:hypothetical protein